MNPFDHLSESPVGPCGFHLDALHGRAVRIDNLPLDAPVRREHPSAGTLVYIG